MSRITEKKKNRETNQKYINNPYVVTCRFVFSSDLITNRLEYLVERIEKNAPSSEFYVTRVVYKSNVSPMVYIKRALSGKKGQHRFMGADCIKWDIEGIFAEYDIFLGHYDSYEKAVQRIEETKEQVREQYSEFFKTQKLLAKIIKKHKSNSESLSSAINRIAKK